MISSTNRLNSLFISAALLHKNVKKVSFSFSVEYCLLLCACEMQ
jgi:hypothetical protein